MDRQTDGIYCFANPVMKKFINVLHLTKYSITIKVMGKIIKAIYYPPSLQGDKFENEFNDLFKPDLVLGDFNIDIGKQDPLIKYDVLEKYLFSNHYQRWIPNRKVNISLPRLDHVFAKENLKGKLYVNHPPFLSDHPSLEVSIVVNGENENEKNDIKNNYKKRYNLENLNYPCIKKTFKDRINVIGNIIINYYHKINTAFSDKDYLMKQNVIDKADEILVGLLQDISKDILGEMKVNTKVNQTRTYIDLINNNNRKKYKNNIHLNNNNNNRKKYNNNIHIYNNNNHNNHNNNHNHNDNNHNNNHNHNDNNHNYNNNRYDNVNSNSYDNVDNNSYDNVNSNSYDNVNDHSYNNINNNNNHSNNNSYDNSNNNSYDNSNNNSYDNSNNNSYDNSNNNNNNYNDSIINSNYITTSIRLFKEHIKDASGMPLYIQSSTPNRNEVEDVYYYYSEYYKPINEKFNPYNLRYIYLGNECDEFNNYVTKDKVVNRINNLSSNKACGNDGIHTVLLKAMNDSMLPDILTELFKLCISFGVTPLRWNKSIIYPIPKKKESCYIQDFRPIALTNIFRKVFEGLLLDFIREKMKSEFKLCGNQAGFRRGYSTITQAIVSNETTKSNQHHVFLDLKKAYDSVPIKNLIEKLMDRKVNKGILSLITSLFTQCSTRILVNNEFTDEIKMDRGLMQGAILSPLLFNIFIDDLAEYLNQRYPNDPLPHSLFFADDIKLNHKNKMSLQYMLRICSLWAKENGMEFNVSKSAYLMDKKRPLPSKFFYLLKGSKREYLPGVESYRYLGFPHTSRGINFQEHLNTSAGKALAMLQSLDYYKKVWPEYIKLNIFRMYIRPVMEYSAGLAIYWMKNLERLKKKNGIPDYSEISLYHEVTIKGKKWILDYGKTCHAQSLLGLPSSLMRLYCLALRLRAHLMKMNEDNPLRKALEPPPGINPVSSMSFSHKVCKWNGLFLYYNYFGLPLPPSQTGQTGHTGQSDQEEEGRVVKKRRIDITGDNLIRGLDVRIKEMIYWKFRRLIMDICILPMARSYDKKEWNSKLITTDKCLYIRDKVVRRRAILWRLNALNRQPCPFCRKDFHRDHINKCDFLNKDPFKNLIQEKDLLKYMDDIRNNPILPKTYNILDSLLNHKRYNVFGQFMEHLYKYWIKVKRLKNTNIPIGN